MNFTKELRCPDHPGTTIIQDMNEGNTKYEKYMACRFHPKSDPIMNKKGNWECPKCQEKAEFKTDALV